MNEKEFMEFIANIQKWIDSPPESDDEKIPMSRKLRREQFEFAYDTIVKLFEQFPKTVVKKEIMGKTAGAIVIEGLPIAITRPRLFFKVVAMANNFEVTTKYKKISFGIMFYGI